MKTPLIVLLALFVLNGCGERQSEPTVVLKATPKLHAQIVSFNTTHAPKEAFRNSAPLIMWKHLVSDDNTVERKGFYLCKVASPYKAERLGTAILLETNRLFAFSGRRNWLDSLKRSHQEVDFGGARLLITPYPIDLLDPVDEATGLYRVDQEKWKWQLAEEAKLLKE